MIKGDVKGKEVGGGVDVGVNKIKFNNRNMC
jgi:hypothetical protein